MPIQHPLHLDARTFRMLLLKQGPSLALWRAAEVAALREITFEHPILDLGCGDGLVTSQVLSLEPVTRKDTGHCKMAHFAYWQTRCLAGHAASPVAQSDTHAWKV